MRFPTHIRRLPKFQPKSGFQKTQTYTHDPYAHNETMHIYWVLVDAGPYAAGQSRSADSVHSFSV